MKPFRWNFKKKEQLGSLLDGERAPSYPGFFNDLSECSAKVVAASGGSNLIFVGRSPENIYDYLSGIFENTPYENKLTHLNMSNRFKDMNKIKGQMLFNYEGLKSHFKELGLSPVDVIHKENGICFVDLVCTGGTYEQLFHFMMDWCSDISEDYNAMKRKMRFLGITSRTKNSPNTWRWQQHADWVQSNNEITVVNASISRWLWSYLGDMQDKVENPNSPKKWGTDSLLAPPREERNIKALRLAYDLYELGKKNKLVFSNQLSQHKQKENHWYRDIINELRVNR